MDVKQNLRALLYDAIIVRNVMDQNEFAKALGESPQMPINGLIQTFQMLYQM